MSKKIDTSINVEFGSDENWFDEGEACAGWDSSAQLKWTPGTGIPPSGDMILLLYPAVPADVSASNGTMGIGPRHSRTITEEIIVFSGDSSTGNYPVTGISSITIINAYAKDCNAVEPKKHPVISAKHGKFKASFPFVGAVRVSYNTSYQEYYWTYNKPPEHAGIINTGWMLGEVFAFYKGAMAKMPIEIGAIRDTKYAELYRVVSEYIADSEGAWEVPEGWPEENSYPHLPAVDGPDQSAFQQLKRTHEIGYCDKYKTNYNDRFHIKPEEPYVGTSNYKIKHKLEKAEAPEGDTADETAAWEEAFASTDWAGIESTLKKRYAELEIP